VTRLFAHRDVLFTAFDSFGNVRAVGRKSSLPVGSDWDKINSGFTWKYAACFDRWKRNSQARNCRNLSRKKWRTVRKTRRPARVRHA